jgi:hypothetical protein
MTVCIVSIRCEQLSLHREYSTILSGITMNIPRGAVAVFFALTSAGLAAVWFFNTSVLFDLFEIGPAYVGCLLLAIGIMIWLANRLWTTQKLLPFLVTGAVSRDDALIRGRWLTWLGRAN